MPNAATTTTTSEVVVEKAGDIAGSNDTIPTLAAQVREHFAAADAGRIEAGKALLELRAASIAARAASGGSPGGRGSVSTSGARSETCSGA